MIMLYEQLHPVVRPLLFELVQAAAPRLLPLGWWPWIEETGRLWAVQQARWLQGRNTAGEVIDSAAVVTNSRPGSSYHEIHYADGTCCSLAFHLRPKNAHGGISGYGVCPLDMVAYEILGAEAEKIGLTWGGRFDVSPALGQQKDLGHFEKRIPGATRDQVQAAILAGQALGASLTVTA